ncbi:hypothetical protein PR048_000305 [Dryococelus australis]|uniref:Uncharacterized protein n=1 Tax=Dryococelus australis TaxID=614101 RepID=A0ABQ9IF59_9NEOP|nr:hypothetical protein PR048_000305 [Dryococelus australis]
MRKCRRRGHRDPGWLSMKMADTSAGSGPTIKAKKGRDLKVLKHATCGEPPFCWILWAIDCRCVRNGMHRTLEAPWASGFVSITDRATLARAQKSEDGVSAMTKLPRFLTHSTRRRGSLHSIVTVDIVVQAACTGIWTAVSTSRASSPARIGVQRRSPPVKAGVLQGNSLKAGPVPGDGILVRFGEGQQRVMAKAKSHAILDSGGVVVRLLASHRGKPGSIPKRGHPSPTGFSHVVIVPDDTAGRWVFSGISRFPRPCILALLQPCLTSHSSALETSLLRAVQISSLTHRRIVAADPVTCAYPFSDRPRDALRKRALRLIGCRMPCCPGWRVITQALIGERRVATKCCWPATLFYWRQGFRRVASSTCPRHQAVRKSDVRKSGSSHRRHWHAAQCRSRAVLSRNNTTSVWGNTPPTERVFGAEGVNARPKTRRHQGSSVDSLQTGAHAAREPSLHWEQACAYPVLNDAHDKSETTTSILACVQQRRTVIGVCPSDPVSCAPRAICPYKETRIVQRAYCLSRPSGVPLGVEQAALQKRKRTTSVAITSLPLQQNGPTSRGATAIERSGVNGRAPRKPADQWRRLDVEELTQGTRRTEVRASCAAIPAVVNPRARADTQCPRHVTKEALRTTMARRIRCPVARTRDDLTGDWSSGAAGDPEISQFIRRLCLRLGPRWRSGQTIRLPPTRTRLDSRRGRFRVFTCGDRAGRWRVFSGIFPPLHSGAAPYSPHFTHIGSQDLAVKAYLAVLLLDTDIWVRKITRVCWPVTVTQQPSTHSDLSYVSASKRQVSPQTRWLGFRHVPIRRESTLSLTLDVTESPLCCLNSEEKVREGERTTMVHSVITLAPSLAAMLFSNRARVRVASEREHTFDVLSPVFYLTESSVECRAGGLLKTSAVEWREPMRVKRGEYGVAPECKGGGKRQIAEKTRRPAASSGTKVPRWKASALAATPTAGSQSG